MKTLIDMPTDAAFAAEFAARQAKPERLPHREAFGIWILGSAIVWLGLFALVAYLLR